MDKIGRNPPRDLLSPQVTGSRYFFAHLTPGPASAPQVALGGYERCHPDYLLRRDRYAYHVLELVVGGAGEVVLNGVRAPLRPGMVFAFAPRMRCEIRTDPAHPLLKYFVCLRGRGCAARLARAGVAPGQARAVTGWPDVVEAAEGLVRAGQQPSGRAGPIILHHLLEVLLLRLEERVGQPGPREELAQSNFLRCRELIDANVDELRSLDDIAGRVGLEASSVCRLFRRYAGISPYQYLLRQKMMGAAEHLMREGGLVKEAAQRAGFADPYHFSRVFKHVHGLSPGAVAQFRAAPAAVRRGAAEDV